MAFFGRLAGEIKRGLKSADGHRKGGALGGDEYVAELGVRWGEGGEACEGLSLAGLGGGDACASSDSQGTGFVALGDGAGEGGFGKIRVDDGGFKGEDDIGIPCGIDVRGVDIAECEIDEGEDFRHLVGAEIDGDGFVIAGPIEGDLTEFREVGELKGNALDGAGIGAGDDVAGENVELLEAPGFNTLADMGLGGRLDL